MLLVRCCYKQRCRVSWFVGLVSANLVHGGPEFYLWTRWVQNLHPVPLRSVSCQNIGLNLYVKFTLIFCRVRLSKDLIPA